jgi:peptidoglycan/LPS O-acetylase OafA/YrhL
MSALLESRKNNFDFIRLFLSVLVIFSHSFPLTGEQSNELFKRATQGQLTGGAVAVDAFFIISGYLIAASFEHSKSLWDYLKKRIFRIFPGYIALALFDLALVLPLSAGHLSGATPTKRCLLALWKVLSLEDFATIGAFRSNPYPEVINGSLWTIHFEFVCYVGLALIGVCGFLRNRHRTLYLFGISLVLTTIIAHSGVSPYREYIRPSAHFGLWDFLLRLVPCYLSGVVVYLYRKSVRLNLLSVATACAVLLGACFVPMGLLTAIPLAGCYLVIYAAYSPTIRLHHFARYGDFSYGTYLYAFPLQQTLVRFAGSMINPLRLFLIATPITFAFAAASWHLVERRFLSRSRVMH